MPLVLVGLPFLLCGVPMLWLATRAFARDRAIARWPRTAGTVVRSWLEKSSSRVTDKNTGLHSYSDYYTIAGEIFDGTSISLAHDGVRTSHDSAKRIVDRYPAGAKVEVLHDPADPKSAHLETSRSVGGIILFAFGLVLFVLGAGLVLLALFSS